MAEMNPTLSKERAEQSNPESTRGAHFAPRVDIFENEKELLLLADVPGARPEDVDLRFENGELLLHARVAQRRPARGVLATEYEEGDFYRSFAIHESIDSSQISAECKNGVLTVHLPKVEAVRPRQIAVQSK